jgi:hypothetical protein
MEREMSNRTKTRLLVEGDTDALYRIFDLIQKHFKDGRPFNLHIGPVEQVPAASGEKMAVHKGQLH